MDAIQLELPLYIRETYKRSGVVLASVLSDYITDMFILNSNCANNPVGSPDRRFFSRLFWDLIDRIFYI